MANINTELEQIRKAVYGREVRGSIANAIELINKEQISTSTAQTNLDSKFEQLIINAGNSNAEVVAARIKADGTKFDTLSKRLDKGDELHNTLNNEVVGARTDSKNIVHKNLKARLDNFDLQFDTLGKRLNKGDELHNTLNNEVVSARTDSKNVTHKNLKARLDNFDSQLDNIETQKATKQEVEVERKRIDSFTSLPSGSTTGDAELMDGRVGADGVTYSNIGNAIRRQMNKKQDAILEYDTIPITLENGLYNNVNATINTGKTEWKHTKVTIEKDINYKISCRGASGEYSSIIGIDSIGGRYVILTGTNIYTKDYILKSADIEKYVSLVINTSDTNTSPIIVKKSVQTDVIKYIDDKIEPLLSKKNMLCKLNGNSCMIRFKYSKLKDCIIVFTDYVNNCFKISHIYLMDNMTDEIIWDFTGRDSTTQFTFINSEWISPYKNLNAINNPITSVTDQWTGGSHAIGSIKTNKIKSINVYCDGVEIEQNIDTKCKEIKLVCVTDVTASNTTATTFENNRYVLRETQEWTITPNNFDVNVKIEFLEDCSLGVNYGLQTENSSFTKLRHYGDSANLGLVNVRAYAYGSNKTVGIANGWCLNDDNGNTLEVILDTTYKCGNRCLIKADTATIVTASYGKTYSYIVSDASFKTGDIVEHRGKYKFYCAN